MSPLSTQTIEQKSILKRKFWNFMSFLAASIVLLRATPEIGGLLDNFAGLHFIIDLWKIVNATQSALEISQNRLQA